VTIRGLRRLVALSSTERRLVLRAVLTVAAVRLGLWMLSPATLLRHVERLADRHVKTPLLAGVPVARLAWAVRAAGRRIPGTTCLPLALAARVLLARYGHTARLRIGVRRSEDGAFEAHAWAEVDGWPVVGGRDVGRYNRLPDLMEALNLLDSQRPRTGVSKA
jgi:hypothetical protein